MIVSCRIITTDREKIELTDLFNEDKGKYYKEPALTFKDFKYDGYWDNSDYVKEFLESLKKGNTQELKDLCGEHCLDYKVTKKDLLRIYKASKKQKWWR